MNNIRIEIRYAVLISLLMLLWLALEYMVGLHDIYIGWHPVITWFALLIPIVCTRLAIREKTELLNGKITFKQAFASGFLIAFFAAVLAIPVQVIFHKVINPDFFDTMLAYTVNRAESLKMNTLKAREEAKLYFNLTSYIIQSGLSTLIIGTVIALVTASLMKTEK
ncbi:MAG TPA: DUF4199 domain-containing protein [Chitinophagales bacterium]|nr:DUF4199 domain-containing protein [Chitinophagales bacterium]